MFQELKTKGKAAAQEAEPSKNKKDSDNPLFWFNTQKTLNSKLLEARSVQAKDGKKKRTRYPPMQSLTQDIPVHDRHV